MGLDQDSLGSGDLFDNDDWLLVSSLGTGKEMSVSSSRGPVAIIGSGMAALGADSRMRASGLTATLYDAADRPGGHTTTHFFEGGWAFDEGPHVSFTKDRRIQELLAEAVNGDFQTLAANVDNYWRGYRFKHPAICNMSGLPTDLVVDCIRDFVEASSTPGEEPADYQEWLLRAYGKTFAETFPMEYAKKVHTTEASNLATDWLGPRLYRPKLEEVLFGALSPETPDVHYVTEYRYPTHGGFQAYLEPFLGRADIRQGHRLVTVDAEDHVLGFANGSATEYEHLISTVPLPEFIPMINGVPSEVADAASRLAATRMVLVNVGIDREDAGDTWTYFYDQELVFTRVSYPASLSPNMCPPGMSSFQAELYFSDKYRPLSASPEAHIDSVVSDLHKVGLIHDGDQVMHTSALFVPYGNIIHDHDKLPALETIHGYLGEVGIEMAGRYGLWGYHWTDEAFKSGEDAAQNIIDGK